PVWLRVDRFRTHPSPRFLLRLHSALVLPREFVCLSLQFLATRVLLQNFGRRQVVACSVFQAQLCPWLKSTWNRHSSYLAKTLSPCVYQLGCQKGLWFLYAHTKSRWQMF